MIQSASLDCTIRDMATPPASRSNIMDRWEAWDGHAPAVSYDSYYRHLRTAEKVSRGLP